MIQFGRKVVLQYGQPGETGVSIEDLRIAFDVEHLRGSEPNRASIVTYGLSPRSIDELQRPGVIVQLLAGYGVPQIIFRGKPLKKDGAKVERTGPERTLTINAQDGGRALRSGRVELTYGPGTRLIDVLQEISTQTGINLGYLNIPDIELPGSLTFSGPARQVLNRVAAMAGSGWMVRDGAFVLGPPLSPSGDSRVLLSADNGNLIGSPTVNSDGEVEATALLEPTLRPGLAYGLQSRDHTGDFVARDVRFTGDSTSGDFVVRVVGRQYGIRP